MWRITLAQVRTHVGRLIASCIAIVIAIGFVVATLVLSETTRVTMLGAVGERYVDVVAVVTSDPIAMGQVSNESGAEPDSGGLADVVDAVRRLEGVAALSAESETFAQVEVPGRAGTQSVSVESVSSASELRWQDLADGRLPNASGEVAASARVGVAVGETLAVTTYDTAGATQGADGEPATLVEEVRVVGVVDLGADPTASVQGRLFATADQVAAWGGGEPFELRVAAEPGADVDALLGSIREAVAAQGFLGTVMSGEQAAENRAADFTRDAAALTTILLIFAGLAVLVAGLVIANTFSVLLAQRTRELALLRCVGASARQVRRGVLAEAAITGFGASLVGVGVGVGLAALTSAAVGGSDSAIPLTGLSVPLSAVWTGLALGTIVTLLAAVFPAVAATRVSPLAALRPTDQAAIRSKPGLLRLALGLMLFLPGLAALVYGVVYGQVLLAVGGGGLSALGTILLLQRVIPPVVALAGRTVAQFGSLPAALAAGNATRNPRRTAATATALLIGVTLTTAMIVGAASTRATAEAALLSNYPTDVIVSSYETELPDSLLGQLQGVDGVATGTGLIGTEVTGPDGQPWAALGVDPVAGLETARSADGGVPQEGEVSIASWLAQVWEVAAGEPVTLTVESRSVSLIVEVNDASESITMPKSDLRQLDPAATNRQIWLRLDDGLGVDASVRAVDEITDVAGQAVSTASVAGIVSLRQALNSILDTMLLVVTALLGVAVVIALIGVGNTLALSVIERRQENGLMRALGLTRGQLRGLLAWEALLIAGVAAVLGVVIGAGYGLAGTAAILGQVGAVVIDIPWMQLLAVIAVATAAGVLASVLPARRAARTSPVAAIAG